MMKGRTHAYVGGLAALTVYTVSNGVDAAIPFAYAIGMLGGLVPDLDKRGSRAARKLPVSSFILEKTTGHRGLLHTPAAAAASYILLAAVTGGTVAGLFALGYLSHLILDSLTPMGIMWLYPLSRRYYRIVSLRTAFRDIITMAAATAAALLILKGGYR